MKYYPSAVYFFTVSSYFICLLTHKKTSAMKTATTPIKLPKANPMPPPILSLTEGTWAHDTMSRRVNEEILQRTFEENKEEFESPEFATALSNFNALRLSLKNLERIPLKLPVSKGELGYVPTELEVRERKEWNEILNHHHNQNWLSAPWVVTEFLVYRLLMDAIGYYNPNNKATYQYDPFVKQKRAGLHSSVKSAEGVLAKIPTLPHTSEGLAVAVDFSLWGNKMDLSIWPSSDAESLKDAFSEILSKNAENLLHNDMEKLTDHCELLRKSKNTRVDVIVDNAGFELVMDLCLADYLVASGVADTVTFQLKAHPTFVSDALEKDLLETVNYYASLDFEKYPNCVAAGERWHTYLKDQKWVCNEESFWVQPTAMWLMTEPLRTEMNRKCDLAFVKGDANYRRLLGDLQWDLTTPFDEIIGETFPCPICALRTLKAELGCGMDFEKINKAKSLDDEWMVNGRFAVVHFGKGMGRMSD